MAFYSLCGDDRAMSALTDAEKIDDKKIALIMAASLMIDKVRARSTVTRPSGLALVVEHGNSLPLHRLCHAPASSASVTILSLQPCGALCPRAAVVLSSPLCLPLPLLYCRARRGNPSGRQSAQAEEDSQTAGSAKAKAAVDSKLVAKNLEIAIGYLQKVRALCGDGDRAINTLDQQETKARCTVLLAILMSSCSLSQFSFVVDDAVASCRCMLSDLTNQSVDAELRTVLDGMQKLPDQSVSAHAVRDSFAARPAVPFPRMSSFVC